MAVVDQYKTGASAPTGGGLISPMPVGQPSGITPHPAPIPSKPPTVSAPATAVQPPQPMAAINPSPALGPAATQTQGVSTRLPGIVSRSGVLGRMAETKGKQYAHQRGLLNSSLAADASHRALLDWAVPIAQSDAGIEQADRQREQAAQQHAHEWAVRERTAAADRSSQERAAAADRNSRELVARNQLSVQRSRDISTAVGQIQSSHDRQYQAVMLSTRLDDSSRSAQVESLRAWTNRQIALVEGVYGVDLDWDTD